MKRLHHLQAAPEASASQQLDYVAPAPHFPVAAAVAEAAACCPAPLLHLYQKIASASIALHTITTALRTAVEITGAQNACDADDNNADDDDNCQLMMS